MTMTTRNNTPSTEPDAEHDRLNDELAAKWKGEADAKHTPGPWKACAVRKHGPDTPDLLAIVQDSDSRDEPLFLAVMASADRDVAGDTAANARLMAAAPDMLKALETISQATGPYSLDHLKHAENCIEAMTQTALEAIAKATEC